MALSSQGSFSECLLLPLSQIVRRPLWFGSKIAANKAVKIASAVSQMPKWLSKTTLSCHHPNSMRSAIVALLSRLNLKRIRRNVRCFCSSRLADSAGQAAPRPEAPRDARRQEKGGGGSSDSNQVEADAELHVTMANGGGRSANKGEEAVEHRVFFSVFSIIIAG